jgi:hypothetical protein
MDVFGNGFVSYISNYGYDRVLRILYVIFWFFLEILFFLSGHNMRDFLNGLDNLHEYMRYTYPRMRPPSFYVEKETAQGLTLHYRSRRRGFVHYVIGQITEVWYDWSFRNKNIPFRLVVVFIIPMLKLKSLVNTKNSMSHMLYLNWNLKIPLILNKQQQTKFPMNLI